MFKYLDFTDASKNNNETLLGMFSSRKLNIFFKWVFKFSVGSIAQEIWSDQEEKITFFFRQKNI